MFMEWRFFVLLKSKAANHIASPLVEEAPDSSRAKVSPYEVAMTRFPSTPAGHR